METLEKQYTAKETKRPSEDRFVMLSDGIFAIATTLLVLDIRLPEGLGQDGFNTALIGVFLTKELFYAITFLVIARYWMSHRRIIRTLRHVDSRFIWLNFLFLAFIAFFPVTSNIIGAYGQYSSAVILYTLVLSGCGISVLVLWLYAVDKRRLVDADLDQRSINFRTINILIFPIYFLASLLLLFFNGLKPVDIFYTWLLIPLILIIVGRIYQRKGAKENVPNTLDDDD